MLYSLGTIKAVNRNDRFTSTPALHCASCGHSSAAGANWCRCACIGSQKAFAGDSQERFEHDCCARLLVRFDKAVFVQLAVLRQILTSETPAHIDRCARNV